MTQSIKLSKPPASTGRFFQRIGSLLGTTNTAGIFAYSTAPCVPNPVEYNCMQQHSRVIELTVRLPSVFLKAYLTASGRAIKSPLIDQLPTSRDGLHRYKQ